MKSNTDDPCPCDDCFNNFHNNEWCPCIEHNPRCSDYFRWDKRQQAEKDRILGIIDWVK